MEHLTLNGGGMVILKTVPCKQAFTKKKILGNNRAYGDLRKAHGEKLSRVHTPREK